MHHPYSFIAVFCMVISCAVLPAFAQPGTNKANATTDSLKHLRKQSKMHMPDTSHSPGMAFRHSGVVPGWGQVYNRKWWKVPAIYTGLGLFGSSVISSQRGYKQYLSVYNYYKSDPAKVTAGLPNYELYRQLKSRGANQAFIESNVNNYQRNMQLSVLGFIGLWGVQMIDAFIDAKFIHSYSMDRNLSFNITPGILTTSPAYAVSSMPSVTPVMRLSVSL